MLNLIFYGIKNFMKLMTIYIFSVDEKSHVMDITDKGRLTLSPDNPETFVIPDLGELLNDIDNNEGLSANRSSHEVEKVHQLHAERSGKIHNFNQLLRAYSMYEKDVEYVVQNGKVLIVDEFTGTNFTWATL